MAGYWVWSVFFLLIRLKDGDAQFCAGIPDNFTDLSGDLEPDMGQYQALPSPDVLTFTEWIFPNTLQFPCSGQVMGWRFRAVDADFSDPNLQLPTFGVYYELLNTPDINNDYSLRLESDSPGELSKIEPGLYQYNLSSPVTVETGDILGIRYVDDNPLQWQLLFEDQGNVTDGSVSYRRTFTGTTVFATGTPDLRYTPLISIIMADDPSPTTLIPTSTALLIEASSTVTSSPTTSVVEMSPRPSPTPLNPEPPIRATPPTPSTTNQNPTATTDNQTNMVPTIPADGGGLPPEAAAFILAAVLAVIVLAILLVLIVLCVYMRRRKHQFEMPHLKPKSVSPLDNPTYAGNRKTLGKESSPVYATLKNSASSSSAVTYVNVEETALNGESNGYIPPEIPREASQQQRQHKSSVVYHEVGPPLADGAREESGLEPQDYALPVASLHSTLNSQANSQPYEVPLTVLQNSQVKGQTENREYTLLESGIYVPTGEEREQYMTSISTSASEIIDETVYSSIGKKYREQLRGNSFFLETEHYWRPASSTGALYDQLAKKKYREIPRSRIRIIKHLGSGQFGSVNLGQWTQYGEVLDVAVKNMIPGSTDGDKVKFLQEAAIMGQFLHPNVVRLHGVITMGEPVMIVLEYMAKGDLSKYLEDQHPKPDETVDPDLPHLLLKFCREIATGMEYLSGKAFIHRDLAARNILVGSDTVCKIGDFGLSRNLEDSNYYITHGGKIPVKWTAPEALNFRKYSAASDVWSFAAVMFETWSLGCKPFDRYTNAQTLDLVSGGYRLPPPPGCPRALYELMIRCWHFDPMRRPGFSAIVRMLSHSDSQLLGWSSQDLLVHAQVSRVGAPREVSENLYQDLQDYYKLHKKS